MKPAKYLATAVLTTFCVVLAAHFTASHTLAASGDLHTKVHWGAGEGGGVAGGTIVAPQGTLYISLTTEVNDGVCERLQSGANYWLELRVASVLTNPTSEAASGGVKVHRWDYARLTRVLKKKLCDKVAAGGNGAKLDWGLVVQTLRERQELQYSVEISEELRGVLGDAEIEVEVLNHGVEELKWTGIAFLSCIVIFLLGFFVINSRKGGG